MWPTVSKICLLHYSSQLFTSHTFQHSPDQSTSDFSYLFCRFFETSVATIKPPSIYFSELLAFPKPKLLLWHQHVLQQLQNSTFYLTVALNCKQISTDHWLACTGYVTCVEFIPCFKCQKLFQKFLESKAAVMMISAVLLICLIVVLPIYNVQSVVGLCPDYLISFILGALFRHCFVECCHSSVVAQYSISIYLVHHSFNAASRMMLNHMVSAVEMILSTPMCLECCVRFSRCTNLFLLCPLPHVTGALYSTS